jgi:hypothetical protein
VVIDFIEENRRKTNYSIITRQVMDLVHEINSTL